MLFPRVMPDPEPLVSKHFTWADDVYIPPTVPLTPSTKSPRDFSSLRSSQPAPFQTLQRRVRHRQKPRNQFHFTQSHSQQYYTHQPPSYCHSPCHTQHHYPQPPFGSSLNWDCDPLLVGRTTSADHPQVGHRYLRKNTCRLYTCGSGSCYSHGSCRR